MTTRPDVSMRVSGLKRMQRRHGQRAKTWERELAAETRLWAQDVRRRRLWGTQNYPPRPVGSRYRRTGRLGRRWRVEAARHFPQVQIANRVPYAVYVVGDGGGRRQARALRHWWRFRPRVRAEFPALSRRLARRVRRLAGPQQGAD